MCIIKNENNSSLDKFKKLRIKKLRNMIKIKTNCIYMHETVKYFP